MWVQILRQQQIEKGGVARVYRAGDWVDVSKQLALRLISDGTARVPPTEIKPLLKECGIVLRDGTMPAYLEAYGLPHMAGVPQLAYENTLILSGPIRAELVPVGFHLLGAWEAAVPLVSYETLACDVGTEAERRDTAAVIRDLRVPLYDTRALFLRRCETCERLLEVWGQQRGDERLGFLRALYQVKPLICALPITWMA